MEFSFFTTNNKSGYKTREKWFSKTHPIEYENIINYSNNIKLEGSFKEKIWFYYNNLTERPKCLTCGNEIKFRERFDSPYGDFCSVKCLNDNKEEMLKRQKKTFNEKYGVDFYPNHNDFIKKQKKSKFEKYGDENYNNPLKSKLTRFEKYGNKNYNNISKYKETCKLKYGVDNYSKSKEFTNRSTINYQNLYPTIKFIKISKNIIEIECDSCGEIFVINKQMMYERYKRNQPICTNCNPFGQKNKSSYEQEISSFLTELDVVHERNFRGIPSGKEIDIYIPQFKLGIEINGLYWHNENFVSKNYHLEKSIECNENGINLIHIFEDEWVNKKEIVKSIIKNKIKKTPLVLYARKCEIKEITTKECSSFLEQNHIQGNVNSKVKIGLLYNEKLVSIMTFSKGRILMGGKSNEWELNRFSNIIDTNVIGAASKLFNYFIKTYQPNVVISYSDIRIFNGDLYPILGFKKIKQSDPNYWYVIGSNRYHRFNFRKSLLIKEGYDFNKTEKEIMYNRKIYRIYDCGNIRWEYNIEKT